MHLIEQLRWNQLVLKIIHILTPKSRFGDHARISKYKNLFAKGYTSNWSEEVFVIKNVKKTAPWTYFINDLNGEKITRVFFMKKNYKKQDSKNLESKK